MWFILSRSASTSWCSGVFWLVLLVGKGSVNIEAVSTARFNANIREFADSSDITNTSNLKTLQKQKRIIQIDRNTNREFDPITFKDSPDNAAASSSQGRGYQFFPHNDFTGHGFSGYEGDYNKGPVIEHFYPEQEYHEPHYVDHGRPHSYHGHHQGLAVKSFLIPLAGVALLSVAAALVTNPVLLQLGVVSGRRRRRRQLPRPPSDLPSPSRDPWTRGPGTGRRRRQLPHLPTDSNPIRDPWTRAPGTWDGATPLPYRELTTQRYAPNTLPRAWLEEVSERPELENSTEILEKAVRKYDSAPEPRGKRI